MFMFWGKRTSYTKRLLKAKVRGEHETECEAQENNFVPNKISSPSGCSESVSSAVNNTLINSSSTTVTGQVNSVGSSVVTKRLNSAEEADESRTARCKDLLKSLKENQLEMLLAAVESYGANLGSCVLVKRRRTTRSVNSRNSSFNEADEGHRAAAESLQIGTSPNNSHNHHHHRHNHHHNNNHNRRQRGNTKNDDEEDRDNEKRRKGQDEDNAIILDDRITATTTTSRLCRSDRNQRSRNSPNTNSEFPVDPHLLCCQIWRWPDLTNSSELKRLPVCHSDKDTVDVCCNPYHWSRLCKPESPPPPYCLIADRLRPEDRAPSEGEVSHRYNRNTNSPPLPGSLTTNGDEASGQREWCTLAYWELGGRVGRLYPVEPSAVNVFDSLLDGDGLCLSTLAENHSASQAIQRTRSKIGLGLTLSQESDGVWAYNRSDNPIFVNSPTLDDPESRTLLVYRVPPGFCLNIFDRAKTLLNHRQSSSSLGICCPPAPGANSTGFASSGPVDVNSVRISFAKGWGPKYSRQEVTSCPCWLEVLLAPCR